MKAKCKCGRVFDVPPDEEGKVIQCAGCGKKIRLPVSPSPAGPPPPAPAKPAEDSAGEFDWGQEFQLEGSSDEPALPAPEAPKLPPMGEEASSLGFESEEFRIDDAELGGAGGAGGGPIDLEPGHIISASKPGAPGTPGAPAAMAAGAGATTRACPSCGLMVSEDEAACPECGAVLEAGQQDVVQRSLRSRRRAERGQASAKTAPGWVSTFWGAFLYSYVAVFAGQGAAAWLRYMFVGMLAALIAPWLCCLLPAAMFVAFGAVIGAMYFYMAHASTSGASPIEAARPTIWTDMVVPALMVTASSGVLVIVPIVVSAAATAVMGEVDLPGMFEQYSQTGAFATGDIAKVAAKGVLILGALFFGAFCFPMVVMLLGAAQGGSSPILKALNPLNVFKAIFKAPAQYLGLWVFYAVNIILTPVVVVLVLVSITVALGPRWARLLNLAGFFGALVYMAGVVGWRMGMFLHRHPKVFDHVR